MIEKQILDCEELVAKTWTVEEVRARQAELRRMKSLILYKEQKYKRQKKIKSKKYRKMLRREREKHKLTLEVDF
jgi:U3 small nucleolar RNA-associated protein 14